MQPNLGAFERGVRFCLGVFAFFAAFVLFSHPIAQVLAVVFGLFALGEGFVGRCVLYQKLGVTKPDESLHPTAAYTLGLAIIQGIIGYEWLTAGIEKLSAPDFVRSMGKTLAYFASKNPFSFYKDFLINASVNNAELFGYLVMWGEVLVGAALILCAIGVLFIRTEAVRKLTLGVTIIALVAGMVMSANFYIAAEWTSAGAQGINMIMFWVQAVLGYLWIHTMVYQYASKRH